MSPLRKLNHVCVYIAYSTCCVKKLILLHCMTSNIILLYNAFIIFYIHTS